MKDRSARIATTQKKIEPNPARSIPIWTPGLKIESTRSESGTRRGASVTRQAYPYRTGANLRRDL
jgi:hypothetical protein